MILSRYRVRQTEIGNYGSVFDLYPEFSRKNQNFEKMKKIAGDVIILHSCTNRGRVPEIWSETDIIFCHFGPFFALILPNDQENQNFKTMKKAS